LLNVLKKQGMKYVNGNQNVTWLELLLQLLFLKNSNNKKIKTPYYLVLRIKFYYIPQKVYKQAYIN
jgi:hypothetical protein